MLRRRRKCRLTDRLLEKARPGPRAGKRHCAGLTASRGLCPLSHVYLREGRGDAGWLEEIKLAFYKPHRDVRTALILNKLLR